MSFLRKQTTGSKACAGVRERFSPYLDGDMTGVGMQSMAKHLDGCADCATEFATWRDIQGSLAAMGPAKPPARFQARLRAAVAEELALGTHLAWYQQLAAMWRTSLAPIALRAATGTAATLLLLGGLSTFVVLSDVPATVQANDEPLGAMTQPHYLYSEVPPQPIEMGREVPILILAKIDDQGRVYDYSILSGPLEAHVERRVQANLLASVFQPATVFGQPVRGHVMMTYSGVSVRG